MIDPPVERWRSLTLVNALIGASRRDPNWTDFLYQGGWQVRALEQDIVVPQVASTRPDTICPDLVLYRPVNRLVLLVEGKVGTVQAGQLERYQRVDLRGVRNQGFANDINDFQVVYCTTEPHRASAEVALADAGMPLVVFADDRVYRTCAQLRDLDLEAVLAPGVPIEGHVPTRYVPIDIDSTPSELCREIAAQMFSFVVGDRRTFTVDDLARAIFSEEVYQAMSSRYKTGLGTRIRRAVQANLKSAAGFGALLQEAAGSYVLADSLFETQWWRGSPLQPIRARVDRLIEDLGGQEALPY